MTFLLFCQFVFGQTTEHCQLLDDSTERLACYDELFPPARTISDKSNNFGKEQVERLQPIAEKLEDRQFTSTIISINRQPRGVMAYQLANGQTWRQTQVRRNSIRKNDQITIRRGRLGGYTLTNSRGVSTSVRRTE